MHSKEKKKGAGFPAPGWRSTPWLYFRSGKSAIRKKIPGAVNAATKNPIASAFICFPLYESGDSDPPNLSAPDGTALCTKSKRGTLAVSAQALRLPARLRPPSVSRGEYFPGHLNRYAAHVYCPFATLLDLTLPALLDFRRLGGEGSTLGASGFPRFRFRVLPAFLFDFSSSAKMNQATLTRRFPLRSAVWRFFKRNAASTHCLSLQLSGLCAMPSRYTVKTFSPQVMSFPFRQPQDVWHIRDRTRVQD